VSAPDETRGAGGPRAGAPVAAREPARSAAQVLFAGLIDDAALFPPASRDMDGALRDHALQRRGPLGWALGRLVVPVSRLDELTSRLAALPPGVRGGEPWRLAAIGALDPDADARRVLEFNARSAAARIRVDGLEVVAHSPREIDVSRRAVPRDLGLVIELPRESWLAGDLRDLVRAVKAADARAKLRTGGTRPGDVPEIAGLLRVLEECAGARLAFKATAGLHHAVRGVRALTYEAASPRAALHGYLNVLLAAVSLWHGRDGGAVARLLHEEDPAAFRFSPDAIAWRSLRFEAAQIAEARREFATAIGSCSFTEPVAEIEAMGVDLAEPR